jgi:hypothetical protein
MFEQEIIHEILVIARDVFQNAKKSASKFRQNGRFEWHIFLENQFQKRDKQSQRSQVEYNEQEVVNDGENRVRFVDKGVGK